MKMILKREQKVYQYEMINLDDGVPKDQFLRIIEKHFNWNFIYEELEPLYSKIGKPSVDPKILFKIHILKFLFHERLR